MLTRICLKKVLILRKILGKFIKFEDSYNLVLFLANGLVEIFILHAFCMQIIHVFFNDLTFCEPLAR